jgi:hypothetical protein
VLIKKEEEETFIMFFFWLELEQVLVFITTTHPSKSSYNSARPAGFYKAQKFQSW